MTREGVAMGEYKVSHMQDSKIRAIVQYRIPFHVQKHKGCSLRKGMNSQYGIMDPQLGMVFMYLMNEQYMICRLGSTDLY